RDEERFDEAIGLYEQALEQKPAWLEGRWALATLLYDTDRFAEASEHFARVVEAHPDNGLALALLGLCSAQTGDHDDALAALMQARSLGIPNEEVASVADYQAALLLNKAGDPDGALEILRRFAKDGNDSPSLIEAFGLVVLRLPLLPGEIPAEKREMILLAGRAGYHMSRSRRTAIGRLAVEELVSRYPAEPNVHFALGMYLLHDDPAAALAALRRELEVSPDHHVAMIQIAFAELKRGRGAEALPMARRAAELAPNVPAAHLALGRALLATNDVEGGVAAVEVAVRLAPENPRLHFALAQAYQQAGRTDDARHEKQEFLRLEKASSAGAPGGTEGSASPGPHEGK
ncbi:MAG: tetratricopeptide repeat protein, partial [Acidobacteria bacterium]|nr:tetratricopeptide repeat protein [Acidobacteriota bacterium]